MLEKIGRCEPKTFMQLPASPEIPTVSSDLTTSDKSCADLRARDGGIIYHGMNTRHVRETRAVTLRYRKKLWKPGKAAGQSQRSPPCRCNYLAPCPRAVIQPSPHSSHQIIIPPSLKCQFHHWRSPMFLQINAHDVPPGMALFAGVPPDSTPA